MLPRPAAAVLALVAAAPLVMYAQASNRRPDLPRVPLTAAPVIRVAPSAQAQAPLAVGSSNQQAEDGALLKRYCVGCHNERLKTAGLMLDRMDLARVAGDAETWEKVVRKLRAGLMPPPSSPRPNKAALDQFAASLENSLDEAARSRPDPGHALIRRLNRTEYTNAIRDLLGLDIDGRTLLPTDESAYGFDNIADALTTSPGLLERFMIAAQKISRLAVGDPAMRPVIESYKFPLTRVQEDRMSEDLPLGTRGGAAIAHYFPADGEYVIKLRLQRVLNTSVIRGLANRETLDVRLDGAPVKRFLV